VFENKVLRRIIGAERDEVTRDWRELRNEELNDLLFIIFSGSEAQRGLWPRITRFRDHTQRRATVGRTPLDE
jgi:hypothetical protein